MERTRRSVAYRSAALYRALLRRMPKPRLSARQIGDGTVLTFGGRSHLEMLDQIVFSIAANWDPWPKLRVVTDGDLGESEVRSRLGWWAGAIEVEAWHGPVLRLDQSGRHDLAQFARREAMGRKLAAVVDAALREPTLYADVDVLWFRRPALLGGLRAVPAPVLAMSIDPWRAYDPRLVPERLPELSEPPFYCAGVMFAHGDFLSAAKADDLLAFAREVGDGLTEQTLLAETNRRLGRRCLPADEIVLFDNDRFTLGVSFRRRLWAARHYVGQVRHLFWRDALALRLGLRPGRIAES